MTIKISQLANLTVVQANTIVPVVSNITGTLTTVQANIQQLQDYIVANGVSANITALYANAATQSDLIIGINSNVTQANLGMKGYVDSISGSESIANVNMKGYVDGQITAANAGVTTANIGIIGYINLGNTTTRNYIDGQINAANAGVTAANVGIIGYINLANTSMKSYVDGQITAANAGVTSANVGVVGYVDNEVSTANIGMKGYVDSVASQSIYGNANVASYLINNGYVNTNSAYANSNVKSYLTGGFDGNIIPSANVTYSLGSETNQWKDLWVSGNTIHIGGTALSVTNNSLAINGYTVGAQKSPPANVEGAVGDTIGDVAYQTNYAANGSFNVYNYYCMQTFTGVITYSDIRGVSGGSASAVLRTQTTHNNPLYAFPQAANVRVGWTMEGGPITGIATITSIQASSSGSPIEYFYEYTINQAVDLRNATGITLKGRPAIWVRSTMSTW